MAVLKSSYDQPPDISQLDLLPDIVSTEHQLLDDGRELMISTAVAIIAEYVKLENAIRVLHEVTRPTKLTGLDIDEGT